jgi:hypothetical protein
MAMPGFGSLMAGRISGYPQAFLGIAGVALTTVFGVRFLVWMVSNWARMHDPMTDPQEFFSEMWVVLRWAFLGMALFGVSWLWALVSSYGIVRSAKNDAPLPPKLT